MQTILHGQKNQTKIFKKKLGKKDSPIEFYYSLWQLNQMGITRYTNGEKLKKKALVFE